MYVSLTIRFFKTKKKTRGNKSNPLLKKKREIHALNKFEPKSNIEKE